MTKYILKIAVFILLSIMAFSAIFSMRGNSATTDEVAHIPAGYSYLVKGDFRMNPEHPPLIKALSAIPLLFFKFSQPFDDWSWEGLNQWELGWNFLYEQGNDADQILFWTRLPIVILMLGIGILIYFLGKRMFGVLAALLALVLFVFDPNIIAHGRLVTTDIGISLFWLLSIFGFWLFLKHPSWKTILFAGLALGLAFLAKFSAILLLPIFLILMAFRFLINKKINLKMIGGGILICLIAGLMVWLGYFPITNSMPQEIESKLIEMSLPGDGTAGLREVLINSSNLSIIRPFSHYLLGLLMVSAHSLGGHTSFLLGEFSQKGWWYYFPVVFLMKTTLPVLILIILTVVTLLAKKIKKIKEDKEDLFNNLTLLAPIVIYFAVSMRSSLNLGIRHLLPIYPLLYLWIGQVVANKMSFPQKRESGSGFYSGFLIKSGMTVSIIILLLLWHAISSLAIYPHYLAYFNDFIPDKEKAYQYITDSSLDWGQDLKRLAKFVEENDISEIKVDYFGGGVPNYYIPQAREWHSANGPTTGWLAVSATYFQSSKYWGKIEGTSTYEWLEQYEPVKIIGRSILVYNISNQ